MSPAVSHSVNPKPKSESQVPSTSCGTKKFQKKFKKTVPDPSEDESCQARIRPNDDDARLLISSAGRSADRRQIASPSSAVVGGALDVIGLGGWHPGAGQAARARWADGARLHRDESQGQGPNAASRPEKTDGPWSGYMNALCRQTAMLPAWTWRG
jgi:hypothetical protein